MKAPAPLTSPPIRPGALVARVYLPRKPVLCFPGAFDTKSAQMGCAMKSVMSATPPPRWLPSLVVLNVLGAVVVLFGVWLLRGGDFWMHLIRPYSSPPRVGLSERCSCITLQLSVKVGWTPPPWWPILASTRRLHQATIDL
jgi:hypothetical protein